MTPSENAPAKKYPLTTQPGLSAKQQALIDAHNWDELVRWEEEGNELTDHQKAIKAELAEKLGRK